MAGATRFSPGRRTALTTLGLSVLLLSAGAAALILGLPADHGPEVLREVRMAIGLLLLAAIAALVGLGLARQPRVAPPAPDARQDFLTGLLNHAGFRERLEEMVALSRRRRWQVGVLVLNIRHFREVNEAHGRAGGDMALRIVASRLRSVVRLEDMVARLSGDRFAVAQTALDDPADAFRLAERIAAALTEPLPLDGGGAVVAADIGVAIGPDDGAEAGLLLTRAEDALAAARTAPQPTIHCFAPGQEAALRRRRQLERDLREAIAEGRFLLHWQPQRRLSDGALIGFEALLRWPHPTLGLIPPDQFIPLAESSGLIVPLGAWVIRTAAAEAAGWAGGLKVAVNLSAVQLRAEGLVATVAQALDSSGLAPHRLELEVTETVLMQDGQHAAQVLAGLRALGVSIALDDFGTGWSSLAYLRRFAFDELKIDRCFLRDLEADPKVEAVVEAILGLGRSLGMRVVAEGIETREQADRLLALGCERGQGWLLGRPMPAEQARDLITLEETRPRKVG